MSGEVWFVRVNDALVSTDEESLKAIRKIEPGECKAFKPIGVRDPVSFKRYWFLMTHTAKHVKQIEIDRINRQPVYMRIFDKEGASEAMKFCLGHYDTMPVGSTDYAIRKARSISYEKMTPEEWSGYMPGVLEVLTDKVAPFIEIPEARDEMLQCLERWQAEAEERAA